MQFVQCSYAKLTIVTLQSQFGRLESMAQKNKHKFKFLHISKCEYVMHSSNRICECDQIQTIEYINIRIYECLNMIKFKYANMYIYEYVNVIKFKYANIRICEYINIRICEYLHVSPGPLQWKYGTPSSGNMSHPSSGN